MQGPVSTNRAPLALDFRWESIPREVEFDRRKLEIVALRAARERLTRWRALAHVHFRAAALIVNLVHELLHQENAASMLGVEIFQSQRVWHPFWIEARALVANDE